MVSAPGHNRTGTTTPDTPVPTTWTTRTNNPYVTANGDLEELTVISIAGLRSELETGWYVTCVPSSMKRM